MNFLLVDQQHLNEITKQKSEELQKGFAATVLGVSM